MRKTCTYPEGFTQVQENVAQLLFEIKKIQMMIQETERTLLDTRSVFFGKANIIALEMEKSISAHRKSLQTQEQNLFARVSEIGAALDVFQKKEVEDYVNATYRKE